MRLHELCEGWIRCLRRRGSGRGSGEVCAEGKGGLRGYVLRGYGGGEGGRLGWGLGGVGLAAGCRRGGRGR